ncbi:hypothetical protein WN943_027347 [Citrus x changshan-huyou]
MVRAPTYDEKGMKKGAWSKEEDDKLRAYILKYGHWNWAQLPKSIKEWQELQAAMDELPEARYKTWELHQGRRGYYHQNTPTTWQ